jgi:ABC-type transporter Mla subunit MlaD
MIGSRAASLRVGLLVVVGLAAAIGLAVFLGGSRIREGATFESYFQESVQGLDVGAPVKFRGVTLGQVKEIGLVSAIYMLNEPRDARRTTYRLVYVRYIIDLARLGRTPDLAPAVSAGLRARLAAQGITGLAYIELDFVDPKDYPVAAVPWTPANDYIPSVPSTLSQVQNAAQSLLAKVNAIDVVRLSNTVQAVLDDVHVQLSRGAANRTLVEAADLMRVARTQVEQADLPGLVADLRAAAISVRSVIDGPQSKELLTAAARAADRLADAAAKLPALIAALDATARRTNAGVTDLQADLTPVLRDARAAAANLRETTEALRRYPAGALLGGPPPREGSR